jgi:cell division protease FtsH
MAGPERKTRAMSEKEKKTIAYHEGGHALVAHALPNTDPVHKVTILPRGRALGYTMQLPLEDKYLQSRSEMLDQLAVLLGGRTAEELVFHEPTTGASNDIEKATSISRAMVTQYGMSDSLGALKFGQDSGEVFLGRDMGHQRDYSEEVASRIDEEVRRLIEAAHDEAFEVLVEYRDVLDNLVLRLMEKETLTKEEVLEVFAPVEKRPSRGSWTGTGKRRPSDKPPVTTPAELALNGNGRSNGSSGQGQHTPDLQKQPSGQIPTSGPAGGPTSPPPAGPPPGHWPPPSPPPGGWNQPPSGPAGNG